MRKFIALTEISDGFKNSHTVYVAIDGINAIVPQGDKYTTLYTNGTYVHVSETVDQIRKKTPVFDLR